MVQMQLRHEVANGRHVEFVGVEAALQMGCQTRGLADQQHLVGIRQFEDFADGGALGHQYEPGVGTVVHQQCLTQFEASQDQAVLLQTRMQTEIPVCSQG